MERWRLAASHVPRKWTWRRWRFPPDGGSPMGAEGARHVDHCACLRTRFHGLHDIRGGWISVYVVNIRRGGSVRTHPVEILRGGGHAHFWRPYHDRHSAGLAAATADRCQALSGLSPEVPECDLRPASSPLAMLIIAFMIIAAALWL